MGATVSDLRRVLLRMSAALDETSAELDRLALIAVDDVEAAEQSAAAVFHALAGLIEREAYNVASQCNLRRQQA
jgi:hypothetical protein